MADAQEQEPPPAAPVQTAVEVGTFTDYLRRVVPVLLDDEDPNLRAFQAAVADKQNVEAIKKFINDPQTPSLLFQRVGGKGNLAGQYFAHPHDLAESILSCLDFRWGKGGG